jgi:hypothetical protein
LEKRGEKTRQKMKRMARRAKKGENLRKREGKRATEQPYCE